MSPVAMCICPRCRAQVADGHPTCSRCGLGFDPASLAAFYYQQAPTQPGVVIMQPGDIKGRADANLRVRLRRLLAGRPPTG
jgi:hypothetical protein